MHTPNSTIPEPWRSLFVELDALAETPIRMVCMGGFVLSMLYDLPRATSDVDVLETAPMSVGYALIEQAGEGSVLHKKYGVYMETVAVAHLPEDYDQRLTELFPGALAKIRLYALDPYDLALSKLERNSPRDIYDIRWLAKRIPLDPDLLRQRYEQEMAYQVFNPSREGLTLELWIEMIKEVR